VGRVSIELSVVMPVYNEAAVVERVLREHLDVLLERFEPEAIEIVVVDDGSTDGTRAILADLADEVPQLVVLLQERNRGPGPALYRAIQRSQGRWLLHLDTDDQTDPHDLWLLWERRDEADLLIGVRYPRRDPTHRLVVTTMTRAVVWALAQHRLADANAPFKLFRRELWRDVQPIIDPTAFAPSLLLGIGAVRRRWRVLEVRVTHRQRPVGQSTFRMGRLAGAVLTAGRQAVVFRVRVGRLRPRPAPTAAEAEAGAA
jgi:glycosyltransferase involved in cell wall biosynthesis